MSVEFIEIHPITLGGPTGDYFTACPLVSGHAFYYAIDSFVNGDTGIAACLVSGDRKPLALDYSGASTLSDDATTPDVALRVPATTTLPVNGSWTRITDSQKRVFVRLDVVGGGAAFVTIRFKVKPLTIIPGPSPTAHPDEGHLVNEARSRLTNARLEQMGIPVQVGDEGGTYGGRQS